ncbi:IS1595 family transposase [Aurantimonas sp. E1-2-R+4]
MGGAGSIVEADETYFGSKDGPKPTMTTRGHSFVKRGGNLLAHKRAVVSLVERGGKVRSFYAERADQKTVVSIVRDNLDAESALYTDESRLYHPLATEFAKRGTVKHSVNEYVRYEGADTIHTNTVEGFYSIFKRGMKGVYQHCGERHLHRYLAEFDFRYNNRVRLGVDDSERALRTLGGVKGRRLTYRRVDA